MKVRGIVCPSCKEFIWSVTRHHFKSCKCKKMSIDGGTSYLKVVGNWDGKTEVRDVPDNKGSSWFHVPLAVWAPEDEKEEK